MTDKKRQTINFAGTQCGRRIPPKITLQNDYHSMRLSSSVLVKLYLGKLECEKKRIHPEHLGRLHEKKDASEGQFQNLRNHLYR